MTEVEKNPQVDINSLSKSYQKNIKKDYQDVFLLIFYVFIKVGHLPTPLQQTEDLCSFVCHSKGTSFDINMMEMEKNAEQN